MKDSSPGRVAAGGRARKASGADAASRRLQVLAEASRLFTEARQDLDAVLGCVARCLSDWVGEACIIRLLSEDGQWLVTAALHHADPAARAFLAGLVGSDRQPVDSVPSGQVVKTGRPLVLTDLEPAALRASVAERYWPYLDQVGIGNLLAVPLRVRGRFIGKLAMARRRADQPYTAQDQALVLDLADRAALCIEIARLNQALQTAETRSDQRVRQELERRDTERKQLEARLLIADRMSSIGTLAGGVAHEINNPLAYVLANLEHVGEQLRELDREFPNRFDELKNVLLEARHGADRVRRIVRDLNTFCRVDADQRGPVDVHRVLELSINMAWNEIRHRARLVKDFGTIPPIEASESRVGQVFLNLLVNAAHAIPVGAADRNEIRVTTRSEEDLVVVDVRDTGCGIAREHLGRIFDPFFTTKAVGVGSGLGLSICHGIVSSLNGQITVESEPGHGTTFRVTLPVSRPGARPIKPLQYVMPTGRRGRILVVDDEPLLCAAMCRALSNEHEVTAIESAKDALRRIVAGEVFDVILCDLMMPDMTGMDFHAQLVRLAPRQADRTIFVTGGAFDPSAREFLDRVGLPRMEKPVDVQALRALVRTLLR